MHYTYPCLYGKATRRLCLTSQNCWEKEGMRKWQKQTVGFWIIFLLLLCFWCIRDWSQLNTMAPVSSVPVFIYSSLNWHHWMWWIKQCWFGKMFDFHMNLLVHSSQSYQLTSRVLFTLIISVSFQHGFQGDIYQNL